MRLDGYHLRVFKVTNGGTGGDDGLVETFDLRSLVTVDRDDEFIGAKLPCYCAPSLLPSIG